MFCRECGKEVVENAYICPNCGAPMNAKQKGDLSKRIPNHMVGAVITTLLCVPCGIIAIVYATRVDSRLSKGDVRGAEEASRKANRWIVISVAIAVAHILFCGISAILTVIEGF